MKGKGETLSKVEKTKEYIEKATNIHEKFGILPLQDVLNHQIIRIPLSSRGFTTKEVLKLLSQFLYDVVGTYYSITCRLDLPKDSWATEWELRHHTIHCRSSIVLSLFNAIPDELILEVRNIHDSADKPCTRVFQAFKMFFEADVIPDANIVAKIKENVIEPGVFKGPKRTKQKIQLKALEPYLQACRMTSTISEPIPIAYTVNSIEFLRQVILLHPLEETELESIFSAYLAALQRTDLPLESQTTILTVLNDVGIVRNEQLIQAKRDSTPVPSFLAGDGDSSAIAATEPSSFVGFAAESPPTTSASLISPPPHPMRPILAPPVAPQEGLSTVSTVVFSAPLADSSGSDSGSSSTLILPQHTAAGIATDNTALAATSTNTNIDDDTVSLLKAVEDKLMKMSLKKEAFAEQSVADTQPAVAVAGAGADDDNNNSPQQQQSALSMHVALRNVLKVSDITRIVDILQALVPERVSADLGSSDRRPVFSTAWLHLFTYSHLIHSIVRLFFVWEESMRLAASSYSASGVVEKVSDLETLLPKYRGVVIARAERFCFWTGVEPAQQHPADAAATSTTTATAAAATTTTAGGSAALYAHSKTPLTWPVDELLINYYIEDPR